MKDPVIMAWLLDAATLLGLAFLAATAIYGLLLLILPRKALGVADRLDRQHSARRSMRPLEVPRVTEGFFYHHHRITGALLLAGVLAFFLLRLFDYPRDSVLARLAASVSSPLATALLDSFDIFFMAANALIGVLALVILFRPSLLKPVEAIANRWLSTRRALRGAEQSHTPVDRLFARHPRLGGLVVLLGSGYIALALWLALA